MDLDNLYKLIQDNRPLVIFVSGKTCVGKSTFANTLRDNLGYEIIELDKIVFESVIKKQGLTDEKAVFVEVYKNGKDRNLVEPFIVATRQLLAEKAAQQQPVVVDGAIANSDVLTDIFKDCPNFIFAYFHPKNLDIYQRNLTNRFMLANKHFSSGLPKRFWDYVDNSEFDAFCKNKILTPNLKRSIQNYAESSQKESEKRMANFKANFSNISIVEI